MKPRSALATAVAFALISLAAPAVATPDPQEWESVLDAADGQTVYWNAWGGDARTNRYIAWVAEQMQESYGVRVEHVKLDDTSSAVARVLGEQQAGNDSDGSIDLIWINGENFAAMREQDLLFGPFAASLPNFALTYPDENPEVVTDFTLPTEGYESPWGKAQITFYYDSAQTDTPPQSIEELLTWARANPGQFSYPRIPDFTGSTFLKQALIELTDQADALYAPVDETTFEEITAPLWAYLDELHPHLWRSGRSFPDSGPNLRTLMSDGELSLAFSFYPTDAAVAVMEYELPQSVRSYVLEGGTLGNVHFVAIPYNSPHKAGALALANFLLSPEAQAQKQSLSMWGDRSVLAIQQLEPSDQALFEQGDHHPSALPVDALSSTLAEPHPSWMNALQDAWLERYGVN
ncbi:MULTISPECIES: ABC transporter substrate-binding protein [unclassified Halomonas]|uniref:ABC transporter substrate-binding protein n=1 Tax=unclassified Halomonas TaxID=2609666 RepID=UPI001EF582A7|nr:MULTISPECIES: ABC transporter substrate-binding protein [unclassified Halomonas]MCG7575835.1 ABC transporter substrate-binding protein [Halomonas sp. MMH1-48]MCG7602897.1 ABC transporter substrate-binding protein [Halomonas sp. MM17-34]MCG7612064.1 ABC transporter substrate-binding protein [Halomonas sp. MM17-29]MCG7618945.1 ABC transporter substrate-binding protein [Halomonas sp. DSH1-27]